MNVFMINNSCKPNIGLMRSPAAIFIILTLVVLWAYSNVLGADFVMWDDDIIIYQNPALRGLSLESVVWAFSDVDSMMRYNPLTLLSYSATYHFFGLNPFGYHLVNWILHGLSSGVLFLVIRRILLIAQCSTQRDPDDLQISLIAVLATLLWALHPLRVEPVSWATDRTYCQAVFFLLVSTWCYLQAVDYVSDKWRYFAYFALAFLLYSASLLSYAIGMTYVVVFFVLDVFLFKRAGHGPGWWRSTDAKKVILEKVVLMIPAGLVAIISVIVRLKSAGVWDPPVSLSEFGIVDRLMQASYIVLYYLYRPFYPVDLSPVYTTLVSFDPFSFPLLLRAAIIFVLFILAFRYRRRAPLVLAVLLSYVVLLLPVMGFFEHPHYPADRYSIISSACLSILLALGLVRLKNNLQFKAAMSSLLLLIGVLSWMTLNQIKVWHDSVSLFSHSIKTLRDDPYRQDIYMRLGKYQYYYLGDRKGAIESFENALRINPNNTLSNYYLASAEYDEGDLEKAASCLKNVLVTNPTSVQILDRLSEISKTLNKEDEATYYRDRATRLRSSQ